MANQLDSIISFPNHYCQLLILILSSQPSNQYAHGELSQRPPLQIGFIEPTTHANCLRFITVPAPSPSPEHKMGALVIAVISLALEPGSDHQ